MEKSICASSHNWGSSSSRARSHTHQIGGDITGVAAASEPSARSSHIDARAVTAACIVGTTVDVDAGTSIVKVANGTFTRITAERSHSSIDVHTIPDRWIPDLLGEASQWLTDVSWFGSLRRWVGNAMTLMWDVHGLFVLLCRAAVGWDQVCV